jgi:hypothetical protein
MGSLRIGVTQRELKVVADMLDCSVRFVKPRSFKDAHSQRAICELSSR